MHLGSGSSSLDCVLGFETIYSLLFVIHLPFDFRLVESIDDQILPRFYIHYDLRLVTEGESYMVEGHLS
jgi:hypothetical protein